MNSPLSESPELGYYCAKCDWDRRTHEESPENCVKNSEWGGEYDGHAYVGAPNDFIGRGAFVVQEYRTRFDRIAEEEAVLTDLVADLMHYAAATETDFEAALEAARMHHAAENTDPTTERQT